MTALKPVEKVEIITLADNYVDLVSMDNNEHVTRAMPLKGLEFSNSILAEHGFSAMVRVTADGATHSIMMDFGLSPDASARNAAAMNLDLTQAESAVLSHGHLDHFGGIKAVGEAVGKKLDLYVHPAAFKKARFIEPFPGLKVSMPVISRELIESAGFAIKATDKPAALADGQILFLGEIERLTEFEKGMPNAFYTTDDDEYLWDPITDDTAIAVNVAGKGLVVLSGCAHSGIVNTVKHAVKLTGVNKVHAVIGGFHLSGPAFAGTIDPTVAALGELDPDFVVPTHCTGRKAGLAFEKKFGEKFIVNMSGTTLTFAS